MQLMRQIRAEAGSTPPSYNPLPANRNGNSIWARAARGGEGREAFCLLPRPVQLSVPRGLCCHSPTQHQDQICRVLMRFGGV